MKYAVAAILAAASIVSAAAEPEAAPTAAPRTERAPQPEFAEITPDELRPAFTRETVLKLNAIVQRSLDAVNEYDLVIDDIRAAVNAAAAEGAADAARGAAAEAITTLSGLHARSKAALEDMNAAVAALEAGDEIYNETLLAGMVLFVEDVEGEIRGEAETLSATLA